MIKLELVISNQLGLHARAASKLVNIALRYSSESVLELVSTGIQASCKSIMGIMMLGAGCGTSVLLQVEGNDEVSAMEALRDLIEMKFGEDN